MTNKIYWLSDSPLTVTGFATISSNILNGLSEKGFDCYYQAHNYIGQTLPPGVKLEDGREMKFTIYGTGTKAYSEDLLVPRIKDLKADVFGILLDTFMVFPWYLNYDFAPAKTLFYFPSDGEGGLPLRCETILKKCNMPVAMSKFAQKQAKELYRIDAEYIPHAIDDKVYFPLPDGEREMLKMKWGLGGKFVVGSVYRNQGRKMPDRMFKAFAKFAKQHPDVVLFLHTDPYDNAAVFDSIELIKRLGIENRVIFSGMKFYKGIDYKKMNEIYNLMDIFFLSTSGEGWGVPITEALSCEVPCVVTDYTTTYEQLIENGECGIPVPVITEITGNWNVERGCMDIDKAVDALNKLYCDKSLREKMGKTGREKVLKYYSWNKVIPMWHDLIKKMTDV